MFCFFRHYRPSLTVESISEPSSHRLPHLTTGRILRRDVPNPFHDYTIARLVCTEKCRKGRLIREYLGNGGSETIRFSSILLKFLLYSPILRKAIQHEPLSDTGTVRKGVLWVIMDPCFRSSKAHETPGRLRKNLYCHVPRHRRGCVSRSVTPQSATYIENPFNPCIRRA